MALDISVSHDRCVGSQMCILTADATFELDDSGQAIVRDPEGDDRDTIVDAASQCPVEAITVVDPETGQELFA